MVKIRFNKRQTESPKTLTAPFLTLTQIILNFKSYRKDSNVNNSKKKYNLYNTKRASNKKSQN